MEIDKHIDFDNISINLLYDINKDEFIIEGFNKDKKIFVGTYEVLGYKINNKFIWSCNNPYIERNLTEISKTLKKKIKSNQIEEIIKETKGKYRIIEHVSSDDSISKIEYIIIKSYTQVFA
jgi:hypothetical protein